MLPQRLAHAVLLQMEAAGDSPDDRVQDAVARIAAGEGVRRRGLAGRSTPARLVLTPAVRPPSSWPRAPTAC